jgi:hypothetical protein
MLTLLLEETPASSYDEVLDQIYLPAINNIKVGGEYNTMIF